MEKPNRISIEQLIEQHGEQLRRLVDRRIPPHLRSSLPVDDIVQEIWACVSHKMRQFEYWSAPELNGWIMMIARLKLAETLRSARRKKRDVTRVVRQARSDSASNIVNRLRSRQRTPSSAAALREASEHIQEAMDGLSDRERKLVYLRFFDGFSVQTISKLLALPLSTVRIVIYRARKKLAKRLGGAVNFYSDA